MVGSQDGRYLISFLRRVSDWAPGIPWLGCQPLQRAPSGATSGSCLASLTSLPSERKISGKYRPARTIRRAGTGRSWDKDQFQAWTPLGLPIFERNLVAAIGWGKGETDPVWQFHPKFTNIPYIYRNRQDLGLPRRKSNLNSDTPPLGWIATHWIYVCLHRNFWGRRWKVGFRLEYAKRLGK